MSANLLSLSFHTCKTQISELWRLKARSFLTSLLQGEMLQKYQEPGFSVTGAALGCVTRSVLTFPPCNLGIGLCGPSL